MALRFWHQLDRIEAKLDAILRMERVDMADEQALDDALAQLAEGQDELGAAVQQLLDKAASSDVDLSDEIATIREIQAKQEAAKDAIANAITAPPADTPPPTEEPPA